MLKQYLQNSAIACGAAAVLLAAALPLGAQEQVSSCVAMLKDEYSSVDGLAVDCPDSGDCTFLAPPGDASKRPLLDAIATKAAVCLSGAGQRLAKEETGNGSVTREYVGDGGTRCALLVSKPGPDTPEGVRLICRDE